MRLRPIGRKALVVTSLLASCSAHSADQACHVGLPPAASRAPPGAANAPLGERIGIQVQSWYLKLGDLERIRTAGFGTVRWGIPWDRVEQAPGRYDWREADRFMDDLGRTHLRSVVILAYGNHLYAGPGGTPVAAVADQLVEGRPPVAPAARAAFARFAAAAAARYRDRAVIWELWNEPDNATFWAPRPDPQAYARLAAESCTAMRAAVPRATIVGGVGAALPNAVAGRDNIYLALRRAGAFGCLDAVSGHAYRMTRWYRQPDPESIEQDYAASRRYLSADLGLPPRKSLLVTEWGFSTAVIGAELQAAYLLRANLVNAAIGVPLTVWYEWRDSRADASDPEAHFGIATGTGGPKAGSAALGVLSRLARGRVVARLPSDCEDVRALLMREGDRRYVVGWTRRDTDRGQAPFYINGVRRGAVSLMPSIFEIDPQGDKASTSARSSR